jgi:urocanate hydratase
MNDGSSIVGNLPPLKTLVASKGVPWLLVSVKSKGGSGILNQVDYVVRVAADGGVAPAEPPKTRGETSRVRYRAIYLFLHKA